MATFSADLPPPPQIGPFPGHTATDNRPPFSGLIRAGACHTYLGILRDISPLFQPQPVLHTTSLPLALLSARSMMGSWGVLLFYIDLGLT